MGIGIGVMPWNTDYLRRTGVGIGVMAVWCGVKNPSYAGLGRLQRGAPLAGPADV